MKKVTFGNTDVRVMYVWPYAHQEARRGEWEQAARDRERFKMRIQKLNKIIDPMLVRKYTNYLLSLYIIFA